MQSHDVKKCRLDKQVVRRKEEEKDADVRFGEVAKEMGWKCCGACGRWVEKVEGCNHITCKCLFQWCFRCGKRWEREGVCASTGCGNV